MLERYNWFNTEEIDPTPADYSQYDRDMFDHYDGPEFYADERDWLDGDADDLADDHARTGESD